MERVLGLGDRGCDSTRIPGRIATSVDGRAIRGEGAARGAAVHALLEWSQANGWREPPAELARRHAVAEGLDLGSDSPSREPAGTGARLARVEPCCASGSARRRRASAPRRRSCSASPALSCAARSTSWSSARGRHRWSSTTRPTASTAPVRPSTPPATRSSATSTPSPWPSRAGRRRWRSPTSSSSARRTPSSPDSARQEMAAGRERLAAVIARIGAGEFPVAPPEERSWALCDGCPALGRLCSGPHAIPTVSQAV